ncbi:hypothetical protein BJG93_35220 [Paraburkholderia sprentiae WSM5005]|uniref:Uncharacterized protein n=2 Tax=Paraburkholderia sprentiae WSM5005 TaxID=754502 RepID=A0A8F4KIW9_9BURK|nr:hypothetical protein [Paraburkholderia sprentiae]QXE07196.1 hypothetical protein BJG93_35220 [Paraburkholderia sprentiae WSM5005]
MRSNGVSGSKSQEKLQKRKQKICFHGLSLTSFAFPNCRGMNGADHLADGHREAVLPECETGEADFKRPDVFNNVARREEATTVPDVQAAALKTRRGLPALHVPL